MEKLSIRYNSAQVEEKWYKFWEDHKLFSASPDPAKSPYCIVIPPPNITGVLHMGHALDGTLQDILIRFRRMQGFSALWIPGCDHAGIASENVVARELAKQDIDKQKLTREEFLQKMWEWKDKYQDRITSQLKKLGCSCDWSRFAFTMDELRAKAVREAFSLLFEEGLIYKGNYIVNWCPHCQTALSHVEVEHEIVKGHLYFINYPLKSKEGQITVATTRPETMLGDTAVAVHPQDKRYRRLINKIFLLPLMNREIPVIADERVDPTFGTGAVKVTPAHDPVDFGIGKTHNLEAPIIMDKQGKMVESVGKYQGLTRFQCREKVLEDLRAKGFLLKVTDHEHAVGHCYRCGTMIEPYLSAQWFINMQQLKKAAIKVVKKENVKFVPERWTKSYLNWMENVRDWCISRQIWWGHPIPVKYCNKCGHVNAYIDDITTCQNCQSKDLKQDPNVLDTWFSSGLWPLSTLGWPEKTKDLRYFYPTSVLITGYEIIYFWVARMITMGLKFKNEVPFHTVYIHPIIRDSQGKKMSKSKGNVVDPLQLIDQYGTDAMRMALAQLNTGVGQDIIFSLDKFESMRNFSNKIWNAARFIIMNLDKGFSPAEDIYQLNLGRDERYILRKVEEVCAKVTEMLESYDFSDAAELLYKFFWNEFCDWYIELAKVKLNPARSKSLESSSSSSSVAGFTPEDKNVAQQTLFFVLEKTLRLLHPFMPFISEEIWQNLAVYFPSEGKQREKPLSIMISSWPKSRLEAISKEVVKEAKKKYEIIQAGRNLRTQWSIPFRESLDFIIEPVDKQEAKIIKEEKESISALLNAVTLEISSRKKDKGNYSSQVTRSGSSVHLQLKNVDLGKEEERLKEQLLGLERNLEKIEKKLANKDFVSKASSEVVKKKEVAKEEFTKKKEKISQNLKVIKGLLKRGIGNG